MGFIISKIGIKRIITASAIGLKIILNIFRILETIVTSGLKDITTSAIIAIAEAIPRPFTAPFIPLEIPATLGIATPVSPASPSGVSPTSTLISKSAISHK